MKTLAQQIRDSKQYKALDDYNAVGMAEGFVEGTQDEIQAAWQYLHDTKLAYSLQGWFGRTVTNLIAQGIIGA